MTPARAYEILFDLTRYRAAVRKRDEAQRSFAEAQQEVSRIEDELNVAWEEAKDRAREHQP